MSLDEVLHICPRHLFYQRVFNRCRFTRWARRVRRDREGWFDYMTSRTIPGAVANRNHLLSRSKVLVAITMAEEIQNEASLLHSGNVDFSAKFFQGVVKTKPDESAVMSAYSVLTPLAQLSLAAEGNSQQELLTTLGLPNTDVLKQAFKAADKVIRAVQGITLKTANRIYIRDGTELNKEFNTVSKDVFDTEVKNVNFADSAPAAAAINEWVESQTNNRIKDLVQPSSLNADTRAVLVNAIYFKGKWLNPFKETSTEKRDFYVTKDTKIDVPMMFQNKKYLYGYNKELKAQLLEIPYEKREASFLVILPEEVDGISALEEQLKDFKVISKASDEMNIQEVNLHLPKFKIESTINLKDVLGRIGVKKIFSSDAQLTKLLKSDESLYITDAIQKAFIEVNEEGAEAAAANAFLVGYANAFVSPPQPPVEFNANHPFMFAIKVHDEIIFTGVLRK